MNTSQIVFAILGSSVLASIVTILLNWLVQHPNQKAERERIEAETKKLHAEAQSIANQAAKEALTDFPFLTRLASGTYNTGNSKHSQVRVIREEDRIIISWRKEDLYK